MQTLKTFWDRRADGTWQIASLGSISLKPKGSNEGCYEVQDDVVVIQPATAGTVRSIMGQSIVPVVANVAGDDTLRCVGTSFFVSCSGLLITAAHVVTDPLDRKYGNLSSIDDISWHVRDLRFGVMIATNPLFQRRGFLFRPFEWASFLAERRPNPLPHLESELRLSSDIAICKVMSIAPDVPHQPLAIVQRGIVGVGMRVGAKASAVGYAGMPDEMALKQLKSQIFGDYDFRLHVSQGHILERFPDNVGTALASTPGPCFSLSAKMPGKMSGSPIFDAERLYVHGVVSRGMNDENGPIEFAYGSMFAPSMGLPIKSMGGATLLDIQAMHNEGMPLLSAPDI